MKDKVVLITGASSGIGRATAIAMGNLGAKLVLVARNMDKLDQVKNQLELMNVEVLAIAGDVSEVQQVKQIVSEAKERFGDINILVCCAGVYYRKAAVELQLKEIEEVMKINFYGCLHVIYEVLPQMIKQRAGNIVVVSSVDGKKGIPIDSAYVASKFALTGFVEVLRQELVGTNVGITTVFPGRVDTPMIEKLEAPKASPKIRPEQVARAIIRGINGNKPEVIVPFISNKAFLILNSISSRIGDWLVRVLKLQGTDR